MNQNFKWVMCGENKSEDTKYEYPGPFEYTDYDS